MKPETVVIGSAYSVFANGENNFNYVDPEKNKLLWWGDKNIREGVTDMIALGRQSIADPLFVSQADCRRRSIKSTGATACDGCFELLARQQKVGCNTYDKEANKSLERTRLEFGPLLSAGPDAEVFARALIPRGDRAPAHEHLGRQRAYVAERRTNGQRDSRPCVADSRLVQLQPDARSSHIAALRSADADGVNRSRS